MKRLVVVACGLVLAAGVSGCGSSAESLMKEEIKLVNELADELESGADQSKIEAISKKLNENGEKLKRLKLSEADAKKVAEMYKDQLTKAVMRVMSAKMKEFGKQTGDVKLPDLSGLGGAPPGKQGEGGNKK